MNTKLTRHLDQKLLDTVTPKEQEIIKPEHHPGVHQRSGNS